MTSLRFAAFAIAFLRACCIGNGQGAELVPRPGNPGQFGVLRGLPRQRKLRALVKAADAGAVEALLLDLEMRAEKRLGRKLLDGETDGLGGAIEPLVAGRDVARLAAARREQFRRKGVVESGHSSLQWVTAGLLTWHKNRSGSAERGDQSYIGTNPAETRVSGGQLGRFP